MQKVITIIVILLLMGVVIIAGCFTTTNNINYESELFRIHIIANSNSSQDSEVKYKIKDEFSNLLTPMLANCTSKYDVRKIVENNKSTLKLVADNILRENNFNYVSKIEIKSEYFPARVYGEYSVPSGDYDGVTVVLGDGKGDNWWCVMFPPLCYYNASNLNNSKNVVYKSKLLEIIKQFFIK